MITAVWTHLRMILISWAGSIKPSLQHFTILSCWTFLRYSVFLYFIVTLVLFVSCGGCKKSPRTFNQWCYIFDSWRSFSRTFLLCNTFEMVFLVSCIWSFSTWVVPVFLLEYSIITLRIYCLLFYLSFDVMSVICKLHNLRSPFKIPFYLFLPIVFSFFYLGTIRRFSWNYTTVSHWRFHDNCRMNTSADVSKFKISQFLCSNVEFCFLSRC
jgi:hypothetical protein